MGWRLGLALGGLLAILLYASPWLAVVLLPGFAADQLALTTQLLQCALPYMFWAGMAALYMACLQSAGIFGPSALSPIAFNLTMLGFIVAAANLPVSTAHTLALGMSCGGFVQCFLQWRATRSMETGQAARVDLGNRPRHLGAGLLGAAAPQLVLLVAMGLASSLQSGMVTALYYAERILELPLGLVGVCLGMASLPVLSRQVADQDYAAFAHTLGLALRWALWLSLAASAGLWAVGNLLVTLLFGHGNFAADAVAETWTALAWYVAAIPACAVGRALLAASTALGLVRLTAFTTLASVGVTLVFGCLGLTPAAAACLGLWLQPLWLWRAVKHTLTDSGQDTRGLVRGRSLWWGLGAAAAAGLSARWVLSVMEQQGILCLLLAVLAGSVAWALCMAPCVGKGLTCTEK